MYKNIVKKENMYIKYMIIIVVITTLISCSSRNNISKTMIKNLTNNAYIVNLHTKKNISFATLVQKLQQVDIVLIGEYHDDFFHHIAEFALINALREKNKNGNLILEMISSDKQRYIESAKEKNISKEFLPSAIHWNEKWRYEDYKSVVESVFYSKWHLIGGNLSKQEINTIFIGAQPMHGVFSTTKSVQDKLANAIKKTHDIKDKRTLEKFVQVQQYKDRRMADKLIKAQGFAVLLAGNYHVDKTMGVPLHINDFATKKKALTLFITDFNQKVNSNMGDFVWKIRKDKNE